MSIEENGIIGEDRASSEQFSIQLTDPLLYDRLYILSVEYSLPVERLVNAAVKRLVSDVDFVRGLRIGKIEME